MPYIQSELRRMVITDPLPVTLTPNELNYVITTLLDTYIQLEGLNYASLNAAIGVLECAKLELYRRIAAPYEDKKLAENGDVYTA